eukprot:6712507-Alexandrium_andersonii.AAC.1
MDAPSSTRQPRHSLATEESVIRSHSGDSRVRISWRSCRPTARGPRATCWIPRPISRQPHGDGPRRRRA